MRLCINISLLLILWISAIVYAGPIDQQDVAEIKKKVRSWNQAHNKRDITFFIENYDIDIYFYGRRYILEDFIEKKENYFKKDTYQKIVSDINIIEQEDGSYKAAFTKTVTFNKKKNTHPNTHLVFKQINGRLKIIAESDVTADPARETAKKNKTEPSNGNPSKSLWFILLFAGLLMAVVWKYKQKLRYTKNERSPYKSAQNNSFKNERAPAVFDSQAVEKGNEFEKFVVSKFDRKFYKLIDWRSDKFHEGHYAENSMLPDMVWMLKSRNSQARFAVECKYRSYFINDAVEIARDYQLDNYRKFSQSAQIPVFIVLGIGGSADDPRELFVIPLERVEQSLCKKADLLSFRKRNIDKGFFYHAETKLLT